MKHLIYLHLFILLLPFNNQAQPTSLPWQTIKIHYNAAKNGIPNLYYDMYKDKKGYIWLGTDRGLLRFDGSKFKLYTTQDGLPDNEVLNLIEDNQGRIWIGTYHHNIVYTKNNIIYNNDNSVFVRKINKRSEKKSYLQPTRLNIDSSILFYYNGIDTIVEVKNDSCYLIPNPVYNFEATEGFFGFIKYTDATYGMITSKGILNFDRSGKTLRYDKFAIAQFGMARHPAQSIYYINGKLLDARLDTLTTFRDTERLNGKGYFIISYINGALKISRPSGLYAANGQSSYHAMKPTVAIEGTLNDSWVGTLGFGVYNELGDVYSRVQRFVPDAQVYQFTDQLLTTPQVVKMGRFKYIISKYRTDFLLNGYSEVALRDSTNKIVSVTCDHLKEQILVCGLKYAYRVKDNKALKIKSTKDLKRMIATGKGYLAMDTRSLLGLDTDFNIKASWARPNILNVLNVNDSLCLIVNKNFLELILFKDLQIVTKGIFKSNFISSPILSASLKDNELHLQTEHTAYKFLWNGVTSYPIRLDIDQLSINKKVFTEKSISLPYGKQYLADLNLSHIDYMYGDCQYEYRFCTDDEQAEWVTASKEQISLLLNNPGDYTLMIRARSSNNTLSNTITYHFSIPTPFWRHSLFLVGITAIVSGAVFYAFYCIQKKQKERQLRHKELELRFFQSELRSLNALMNPHFTFNALNSIQFLINDRQNELAQKYLSTFARLLRRNLHNLESECVSLEDELELIKGYLKLEQMRMKHNFHYSIYIEPDIKLSGIQIPPLLIQPLVENAVLHGIAKYTHQEGRIKITITSKGNSYCISVMDNGAEAPELNLQKSFGLKNIIQRIEQINSRYNKRYKLSVTPRYPDDQITWTRLDIILEG